MQTIESLRGPLRNVRRRRRILQAQSSKYSSATLLGLAVLDIDKNDVLDRSNLLGINFIIVIVSSYHVIAVVAGAKRS